MLRNAENAENADCDPLTTSPTDANSLLDKLQNVIYFAWTSAAPASRVTRLKKPLARMH